MLQASTGVRSPDSKAAGRAIIPVGILYSLTGTYGAIGREMLNGVLMAIEQANAHEASEFFLEPVIRDPGGSLDQYYAFCSELLHGVGVRHVIGCYVCIEETRIAADRRCERAALALATIRRFRKQRQRHLSGRGSQSTRHTVDPARREPLRIEDV